eukprot:gene17539-36060_t
MSDTQQRIDGLVKSSEILLFMKGSASFPMCGFSGRAIQILKACGVDPKSVVTVNVLEDDEIRQGIKEYSNWPTIPQLYVKGEFIGGSDIMMEIVSRLVVGLTGATGAAYALRLLRRSRELGVETHLIATPAGILNAHHELGLDRSTLEAEATHAYSPGDIGACIASGSFTTAAMVVAPCAMK